MGVISSAWGRGIAAIAAGVLAVGFAGGARAATLVDFSGDHKANPYVEDGFAFDPNRIVNGNCLSAGGCLALNDNETTAMTRLEPPSQFTLQGLSFTLLGKGTGNTLTISGSNGTTKSYSVGDLYKHNEYYSLLFPTEFQQVSSLVFSTSGGGNVRIDDVSVAPVPLPAAGFLLLAGLGAFGALRRRALA